MLPTFSQKPVRDPQAGARLGEDASSLKPAYSLLRACYHSHRSGVSQTDKRRTMGNTVNTGADHNTHSVTQSLARASHNSITPFQRALCHYCLKAWL